MDLMTVIAVAGSAGTLIGAMAWHEKKLDCAGLASTLDATMESIKARDKTIARMNDRLAGFEAAAFKRKKVLSEAGKKGRAAQIAKAAEVDSAARGKTMTALVDTKLRSRAQVVAPVKAARTRAQNKSAGAGMAAKQGG